MKQKTLRFIVPLKVYPFDVMVSFGETNEQLEKVLRGIGITADDDIELAMLRSDTISGRACMFSSNQSLIRLTKIPVIPRDNLEEGVC